MTDELVAKRLEVLPGGSVFVFPEHMKIDSCEAVKNCHQFASQAATAQFHPSKQAVQWFECYIEMVQATGWIVNLYKTNTVTSSTMKLELSNLLGQGLKIALGAATGGVLGAAKEVGEAAVQMLAESPDTVKLFDRTSEEDDCTALSLAFCDESEKGEVVMLLSAAQTDADPNKKTNPLLFTWASSGGTVYTSTAKLSLHRSLYEDNKDVLVSRLGGESRKVLLSAPLKRRKG
ncbi:hypothetical protein PAGU2196_46190 [Pseudomonas sp. PAGU 2196]|uniref:hypothetical protein n=1 Tax=Pseudomonas sp. PAGU 2196 TaxID=2793997 RepID=UPI001EDDBBAF|nr:hypothetical protein [Pseudomonas sp. PAGU 2196]GHS83785.1 hypothetical protein PAGU2196_46190 [Pseudomonas sp. PAGU 2196]